MTAPAAPSVQELLPKAIELAVETGTVPSKDRLMKVEILVPKPSPRRLAGAVIGSTSATLLLLIPGLLGWPGAALTPMLTVVAIVAPAMVIALVLVLMERKIVRELKPAVARPLPEHDQVRVTVR